MTDFLPTDLRLGDITILFGEANGRYPDGNSLLVSGRDQTLLVDPSLGVQRRGGAPLRVDQVVISHAHEDHLAGLEHFPGACVWCHEADLVGVQSLDGLLQIYGMDAEAEASFREDLVDTFHISGRVDASTFEDGHVFDLGGRTVTVVHLPGHTRGHCGLMIEPDGFFYVADIDLTGFGPYYGDEWSDLEGFEGSIERCRELDAQRYLTFHQKGFIDGRGQFLDQLQGFADVIRQREEAMVAFMSEPRSLEELAAHRFIYRPHVDSPYVNSVELRCARRHLDRMLVDGSVTEVEPGRFRSTGR